MCRVKPILEFPIKAATVMKKWFWSFQFHGRINWKWTCHLSFHLISWLQLGSSQSKWWQVKETATLSNERQNEIAMNRGSTLRWAWNLHLHGQIRSLSKVLRQVFLINIRFCDFLNLPWFTPALVRGLESILAQKEMTKSNSLQKTLSYVVFLQPIKILSNK